MRITEKSLVIRELQERLYYFYKLGYDIPAVFPDGIYEKETREAVRAFRSIRGLPDGDIADIALWRELFEDTLRLT